MVLFALVAAVAAQCPTAAEVESADERARRAEAALALLPFSPPAPERDDARRLYLARKECQRQEHASEMEAKAEALAKAQLEADAEEARAQELLVKPKVVQAITSASLCDELEVERAALASIKEERANSRIAGVVSLSDLKELQDKVVQSRRLQKAYRDRLQVVKLPALACSAPAVVGIDFCQRHSQDESCGGDAGLIARLAWQQDLRNR